jgi:hypothetical protein
MSVRGIDTVIDLIKARLPGISVDQLQVKHPGADDNGLWFFSHPAGRFEAQLESHNGEFPFLVDSDGTQLRAHVASPAAAVEAVVARLGLPPDHPTHRDGAADV